MQVQTAAHGKEALYMWHASKFDLVLTDCNMPEMDGYALTRALREAEAKQGRARIPVLGWTANALPSSLSDCQAAGMDDVLTKPSDLRQLRALVSKWLPSAAPASGQALEQADTSAIDLTLLCQVAGSDPHALREFVGSIRQAFQVQIPELSDALHSRQPQAIAQAGHKLKGAAGAVGAQALMSLCGRIEVAAQAGHVSDLPGLGEQFAIQAQRVLVALDTVCDGTSVKPAQAEW
jgi:CheY-like chemotaxis protein/HPt (histidine-containing phosphotransfer) domain-containing protein